MHLTRTLRTATNEERGTNHSSGSQGGRCVQPVVRNMTVEHEQVHQALYYLDVAHFSPSDSPIKCFLHNGKLFLPTKVSRWLHGGKRQQNDTTVQRCSPTRGSLCGAVGLTFDYICRGGSNTALWQKENMSAQNTNMTETEHVRKDQCHCRDPIVGVILSSY